MELLDKIVECAENKKAVDISVLKVTELTTVTDYFLITNGTSSTQNQAIADEISKKSGTKPISI